MRGQALILDDYDGNIQSMQDMRCAVYDYLFVSDVKSALYVLYEFDVSHKLDVLACNANLKNGDVFEFVKMVKTDARLLNLPLICYCVTPDLGIQALRVVAEAMGADEFIAVSEFDARTICREIDRWLARGSGFVPPPELGA